MGSQDMMWRSETRIADYGQLGSVQEEKMYFKTLMTCTYLKLLIAVTINKLPMG